MKRKLLALGMMAALLFSMPVTASASGVQDVPEPAVVFTGKALEYQNYSADEFGKNFEGMMPGETRVQTIELKNTADFPVSIYMSTAAIDNLVGDSENTAMYEIELTKEVKGSTETLYTNQELGGQGGNLTDFDLSADKMDDSRMLIAELAGGESCYVRLSVGLDGKTMKNQYQMKAGLFEFEFSAAYADEDDIVVVDKIVQEVTEPKVVIVEKVREVIQDVKTGDPAAIATLAGAFIAAAAVVVLLVFVFLKRKKAEE